MDVLPFSSAWSLDAFVNLIARVMSKSDRLLLLDKINVKSVPSPSIIFLL